MKILVIEDKQMHRDSAVETLKGHELTIVSSFDEAMEILSPQVDFSQPDKPKTQPLAYDVVLTDMMMPMSQQTLAREVWNPREQVPYGFILALKAAKAGAKFVAMLTDTNHHRGAMSAAIDHLGNAYYREGFKPNFVVNGAKVMFVHAPFVEDPAIGVKCYNCLGGTACGYCRTPLVDGKCPKCDGAGRTPEPCHVCKGKGKHDTTVHERKDWGQVLKDLTAA